MLKWIQEQSLQHVVAGEKALQCPRSTSSWGSHDRVLIPRERARSSTREISLKISQKKLRAPTSATSSPHLIGIASSSYYRPCDSVNLSSMVLEREKTLRVKMETQYVLSCNMYFINSGNTLCYLLTVRVKIMLFWHNFWIFYLSNKIWYFNYFCKNVIYYGFLKTKTKWNKQYIEIHDC